MQRRKPPQRTPSAVLAGLRGEVTAFLRDLDPALDVRATFDEMAAVVRLAEREAGLTELGGWHLDQARGILHALRDEPVLSYRRAVVGLLVTFLADSGRWTGSTTALDELRRALNTDMSAALREAAEQHADLDTEAEAVASTDVVAVVTGFLTWFGVNTRQVTGTNCLRRADTRAAIDHLGLPTVNRSLTSMWDHPELADLWMLCRRCGLVGVDRSRAGITDLGLRILRGDPAARRTVVAFDLARELVDPPHDAFPGGLLLTEVAEVVLQAVIGAGAEVPAEIEDLDLGELALYLRLNPLLGDDELDGLAHTIFLHTLLSTEVFAVDQGRLRVMPGLESLALTTVADLLDGRMIADGGTLLGLARYRKGAVECDPVTEASTLQLTVTSEDWTPAVWRTVEVPAGTRLADLHVALARSFGHEDDRHEFTMTTPVGQDQCWTDHAHDQHGADETAVTVLDVVSQAGRLVWGVGPGYAEAHRIELDAVRPGTDDGPRVVDRRGWCPTSAGT